MGSTTSRRCNRAASAHRTLSFRRRGIEYYDRAILIPPALERYSHAETGISHVFAVGFEVSAAAFRDRTDTEALFVSTSDGQRGILLLDTSNSPSEGLRFNVNRLFR